MRRPAGRVTTPFQGVAGSMSGPWQGSGAEGALSRRLGAGQHHASPQRIENHLQRSVAAELIIRAPVPRRMSRRAAMA